MRFEGGKRKRVAIKRFRRKLSAAVAHAYEERIQRLARAGVDIPKMGMIQLPNKEWVQVSELFGSTTYRSKFLNNFDITPHTTSRPLAEKIIKQVTLICNAGYFPMLDAFGLLGRTNTIKVIDIDRLYSEPPSILAGELFRQICLFSRNWKDTKELFEFAMQFANAKMKRELAKQKRPEMDAK